MLRRKRIVSMGLTLVFVATFSSGAYYNTVRALEETKQAKMSVALLEKFDAVSKKEKVSVAIELENINLDKIEKMVDNQTGMTWNDDIGG